MLLWELHIYEMLALVIIFLLILGGLYVWLAIRWAREARAARAVRQAKAARAVKIEKAIEAIKEKEQSILVAKAEERKQVEKTPPEVERLAELLRIFKASPHDNWETLVAIGDVYAKGAYPRFRPDEDMALECFKIAVTCPNGDVVGIAQSKYIECREESIASVDRAGKELPRFYGVEACRAGERAILETPWDRFTKPKAPVLPRNRDLPRARDPPTARDLPLDIDFGTLRIDSQNVHDHSVTKTIKRNLDVLKGDVGNAGDNVDHPALKERVRHVILEQDDISQENKYDALTTLESLSNSVHSSFNTSEVEVLNVVWSKVKDNDDLKNMLVRQLASGVEHGHVVCSTGKISRMVGTFDGMDVDGVDVAKPMWVVKDEIATLAGKIRDEQLNGLSSSERYSYEQGDDNSKVAQQMKTEFEERVKKEYVEKLGMSMSVIAPITEIYSAGF